MYTQNSTVVILLLLFGAGLMLCSPVVGATDEGPKSTQQTGDGLSTEEQADGVVPTAGLEGDVTTSPEITDEQVVVGTDQGMYKLSESGVDNFIEVGKVEEFMLVGDQQAIVLVEDQYFPNIKSVDLNAETIEWASGHDREVYDPNIGHMDRQVPAFDIAGEEDQSDEVIVAAGEVIISFDVDSGEEQWKYTHNHNVWELEVVDDSVYAGTQDGKILSLREEDGEIQYEEKIARQFEEIPRSVWDIETIQQDGDIFLGVTTEDGTVHLIDGQDGSAEWKQDIYDFEEDELNRYYRGGVRDGLPSLPGDSNYKNIDLFVAGDADEHMIVTVEIPEGHAVEERFYNDEHSEMHLVDPQSGEIEWSEEQLDTRDIGNIKYSSSISEEHVLVTEPAGSTQEITKISLDDGSTAEYTKVEAFGSDTEDRSIDMGYLAAEGEHVAMASTKGDLHLLEASNPQWRIPSIRDIETIKGDFTGDGVDDLLAIAKGHEDPEQGARGVVLRSGTDGSIERIELMDRSTYDEEGGLQMIQPVQFPDQKAILALQSPEDHGNQVNTQGDQIIIMGEEIHREIQIEESDTIVDLHSVAAMGDLTENNYPDILVSEDDALSHLALNEDGQERNGIDEYGRFDESLLDTSFENPRDIEFYSIEDQDSSVPDVFAVDQADSTEFSVLDTSMDDGSLTLSERVFESYDERRGWEVAEDLIGDGYNEILIENRDEGEVSLYSPERGNVIAEFDARNAEIYPLEADLTGDGEHGFSVILESEREMYVYDGSERLLTQEYSFSSGDISRPVAPVSNLTEDGEHGFGVVKESDEGGAKVAFYVGNEDVPVSTFEITPWEEPRNEPSIGTHAQEISDLTGDGTPEFGVAIEETLLEQGGYQSFHIFDPHNSQRIISGPGQTVDFAEMDSQVMSVYGDGAVEVMDPDDTIEISEVESGSEVSIEWETPEDQDHVVSVRVDGEQAALTTGDDIAIELPEGDHDIQVLAIDDSGIVTYDETTVEVEDGSIMHLVLYTLTGLSLVVLLGIRYGSEFYGRIQR